ncbi:MAG TPA: hypothetical protein VFL27_02630 [Candidatus Dormibacteraeota bacterium]|nr:hypothetical protein [Candidatus Dormibacteraeota bacterium]
MSGTPSPSPAPGPQIITLVDPAGHASIVDQGHYGLFAVITPSAIWATGSDRPGLNDVQRIDPVTRSVTDWFQPSRGVALPIGVDAVGAPIVAVGTQTSSGAISATEIDIVPAAATGAGARGFYTIYADAAHPLTIVGWPILSSGALWLETDRGLLAAQGHDRLALVSAHSGFISGGCL